MLRVSTGSASRKAARTRARVAASASPATRTGTCASTSSEASAPSSASIADSRTSDSSESGTVSDTGRQRTAGPVQRQTDLRSSRCRVEPPNRRALEVVEDTRPVEVEDPHRAVGGGKPVDPGLEPDPGDLVAGRLVEDADRALAAVGDPDPPVVDGEVFRPLAHLERPDNLVRRRIDLRDRAV